MNETQKSPSPPRLIPALVAGFDAITNHIVLILFPVAIDLFLWLGPHLRLKSVIEVYLRDMSAMMLRQSAELGDMLATNQEVWEVIAQRFNLLSALRSFPVGIPSLMAGLLPVETPLGAPQMVDVPSLGWGILQYALLTILGLVLGALYFRLVSQAATQDRLRWVAALRAWPRLGLQVVLLALIWALLLLVISVPAFCIITFIGLIGISFMQLGILLYGGFLVWLIFPLLFSPHGIFIKDLNAWKSIRHGVRITSATLPTTSLFFLSVFVITQGLDLLWRVPPENSWLLLIGLAGHAFVATGLLSASFIYYRDANSWVESMIQQVVRSSSDSTA
ncbi:MAG: hypothetical protein JW862_19955 [Anaerolineales bacterium]|nr:hypothetical protein [Anaerolineales bacterium]